MSTPSQAILAQIADLKGQYQKVAFAEFESGFKDLFAKYSRLNTIRWTASKEFNDSDGYDHYSSHEEPTINGWDPYMDQEHDDEGEDLQNLALGDEQNGVAPDKEAKAIVKAVKALASSFDGVFYEEHFYEGGNVVRDGSGITIE